MVKPPDLIRWLFSEPVILPCLCKSYGRRARPFQKGKEKYRSDKSWLMYYLASSGAMKEKERL
jgi:hypothetical protein